MTQGVVMGFPSFDDWKAEQSWDEDSFDAERAMKLLYSVRKELDTVKVSKRAQSVKLREVEDELENLNGQDVTGQVSKLTKERDEALRQAEARLKYEVGIKAGLSYTQAKRLAGDDQAALEADVEELLKDLGLEKPGGSDGGEDGGDEGGEDAEKGEDGRGQGSGFIEERSVVRGDGRADRADSFNFDSVSDAELDKLIPWSTS